MIKMTGYRVLVKPDPFNKTTKGGIILQVNEKLERAGIQQGVVVDVGPSAWKAFREVDDKGKEHNGDRWAKVGDYVLYAKNAGRFIADPFEPNKEDDDLYVIMNDEDIIGIIKEGLNTVPENKVQKKVQDLETI